MKSPFHVRAWYFLQLALVSMLASALHAQVVSDGSTATLSNVTNNVTGDVTVGTNGAFTLLVLSNNVLVTNSLNGVIGRNLTAKSNEVRLISSTARWRMGGTLYVGSNGSLSRLVVSNGALLETSRVMVGNHSASSNNEVVVTGPGSTLNSPNGLLIGADGNGNRLSILNGGKIFVSLSGVLNVIGFNEGTRSNSVLVADPGSRWSVNQTLFVGSGGNGNTLVVSNGALVDDLNGIIGGGVVSASNNLVMVTGTGSTWTNGGELRIGDIGPRNQLIVSNGGNVFVGGAAYFGFNTFFSLHNLLTMDGGTLRVTNATTSGLLDVRGGTLTLNSGLLEVDQLLVTNTATTFDFNSGTLSTKNNTINNGQPFRVGNGLDSALLMLAGNGTHSFGNGLLVAAQGFLSGNGTITGTLTVQSGGGIAPGDPIGKIILSNSPLLQGSAFIQISKNGTALTNDQIQVTGPLTYGGVLFVLQSGNAPLSAGDRFQLFNATSYAGSFSSVGLPSLQSGLTWTNKLLVDGSIEVVFVGSPPVVQTLGPSAIGLANATLNGSANPGGLTTFAWFEWGATTNYGNFTPQQALGNGTTTANFSEILSGLNSNAVYHFRAAASNSLGARFGADGSFTTQPVLFDLIRAGLPDVSESYGSVAWGDYDQDGWLDVLLTGKTADGQRFTQVWRNTGGAFTEIGAGLPGVSGSSVAWGDYDNDGRLDILLAGNTGSNQICEVWRNTSGGFSNIDAGLPGIEFGSVAWGDYDNDGRLDILLTGASGTQNVCQIWRNTGSGFTNINAGLPGVVFGKAAWGDFDNDGRLDVALAGTTDGDLSGSICQVWRNSVNGFTNINAVLPGVSTAWVAWGDYDNDGRLDLLLTGRTTGISTITRVLRNTGNGFVDVNAGLPGVSLTSVAWGDYDNDGRLDILLAGSTNVSVAGRYAQLWRNTTNGFVNVNAGLNAVLSSSVAWGDYDRDGKLDILLMGLVNATQRVAQVWRNISSITNTPPTSPTGLTVTFLGDTPHLAWNAASDAQTPASGLNYNVRVGSVPDGADLVGPMAVAGGQRLLPQLGNAQQRQFLPLVGLTYGQTIYWSVQTVDSAFAGGSFSTNASFTFSPLLSVAGFGSNVTISWTPPLPGFALQESLSLAPVSWSNSLSGETNPIPLPAAGQTKFFRLFKP